MKKVIITGSGGYIGSISTYLFLQSGYKVIALDNFVTGYEAPLKFFQEKFKDQFEYQEIDLKEDLNRIFKQHSDTVAVVHYAAHCSVNESMEDPGKYFKNNDLGTLNLIQTMVDHKILNLVFSSTCAVYGEAQYMPVDEKHPTDPKNPYGESKLIAEKMIKWYSELKGLNYVILRYFNVCGASDDGLVGDSKKPSSLLVQNAVRGALGIEPFFLTCPKVDTPDGTPIRDYINVVDLNTAHLKAVEYLVGGGSSEIINLGTGKGNSVLEIIETVKKITGGSFDLKNTEARKGEYAKMIASIEKAKNVLNWTPERSIEDSINSLVKWYKSHPKGWN